MDQQQKKQAQFSGAYLLIALAALFSVQSVIARCTAPKPAPMSELLQRVRGGKASEEPGVKFSGSIGRTSGVETLDRTDIETPVSLPSIAAAKA